MQTFYEWIEQPEKHPFHSTAVKHGFKHDGSSSAANTTTHEYTHPSGHSLQLHTNSRGFHNFHMTPKTGAAKKGESVAHLNGAMLQAR